MIKKQVEIVVITIDIQPDLVSNKGESVTEFKQKFPQVMGQGVFDLAFPCIIGDRKEIEKMRTFQNLVRQNGLWRRQCPLEVSDGFARPSVVVGIRNLECR
jgi:hypothetical protein